MEARMPTRREKYMPRLLDEVIETHLRAFGAVEVAGTMWSGKTWTSLEHAASSANFDDRETRELASIAPEAVLAGDVPHVLDEWQLVPSIWDVVRRRVDESAGQRGLYILTGSSRPAKKATVHSGSGRISRLRMWPMTLDESDDSLAQVSFSGLFEGDFSPIQTKSDASRLATLACRGGWPDVLHLDEDLADLVASQYVDTLVSSEDENSPESEGDLRLFLQSLARNIGSAPKIDTLVSNMGYLTDGNITETGRRRVRKLIAYFTGRFVVDTLPGWDAPIKSPQRLRTKPRYDFADPSIPAALLGLDAGALLGNTQTFGQIFEQMCLRDLRVYTSVLKKAKPDSLRYYRDADGLEVDAIIELRDGRWAGVEIKLSSNKVEAAEESLLRLKAKIAANPAARNPEPAFLLVLVGVGEYAYRTPKGVYVVPALCLGA